MKNCRYCKIELRKFEKGLTKKKLKKNWPNYYSVHYRCDNCGRYYYFEEDKKLVRTPLKLI